MLKWWLFWQFSSYSFRWITSALWTGTEIPQSCMKPRKIKTVCNQLYGLTDGDAHCGYMKVNESVFKKHPIQTHEMKNGGLCPFHVGRSRPPFGCRIQVQAKYLDVLSRSVDLQNRVMMKTTTECPWTFRTSSPNYFWTNCQYFNLILLKTKAGY